MFKSCKIKSTPLFLCFWVAIFTFNIDSFSKNKEEESPQAFLERLELIFSNNFFDASNSSGFKIIKDSDVKMLEKLIFQKLKEQGQQLFSLSGELQVKKDSIDLLRETSQSLLLENKILKAPKPDEYLLGFKKTTVIFPLIIAALIGIIIYQLIFFIKSKKEYLESKENCLTLDKDFELYKRNAIERERKLVREIIDLKNKLSE